MSMAKRFFYLCGLLTVLFVFAVSAQTGSLNSRGMLLKSVSASGLVETARDHQWSLGFSKNGMSKDTIHIIAVRVEFKPDTSSLTTGNGRFGMWDTKEQRLYSRGVYKYDDLDHDSAYFAAQLTALSRYYDKVSRGNLTLNFSVYPSGSGQTGYEVPQQMTHYSPGWKRKTEKTDEYWDRKTHGLMLFIKDAIEAAANRAGDSPFSNLYRDDNGTLRDSVSGHKAAILIFHAGASYLTDGGLSGQPDSPSDMIDAFINRDFFRYFKDTLGLSAAGIDVTGRHGEVITVDEVMMCAETSNQDSLNWGIQGILVNQMARQLGIPDLFSTSSGISAIGAFCIMDFAGYSAGQGFIPPYPSAWVRAFMGWDKPHIVGAGERHRVKALTSVLDNPGTAQAFGEDTTILLIPLNNNEYYLIENRQRNLSGDPNVFNYDDDGRKIISAYPFNVNIPANVRDTSSRSRVILEAKNNDISLPASGVLVWHVDERVIHRHLTHNLINADSSYRGVRLVEADGINDIGVVFSNMFYQAVFDYGGAEDVFPHRKIRGSRTLTYVDSLGPYTRPSTRTNDGGHSYLNIKITPSAVAAREERTLSFQNEFVDTVINYSAEEFLIDVDYRHLVQGWPRRAAPETVVFQRDDGRTDSLQGSFFDPLITEFALTSAPLSTNRDTVLTLLSQLGRLYLYSVNGAKRESHGNRIARINFADYHGKTVDTSINVIYFDSIPGAYTFPTAIDRRILIPSTHNGQHHLHIYHSADAGDKSALTLPAAPASYVCGIDANTWALGLANGRVITGSVSNPADTNIIRLPSDSPVNAIAVLKESQGMFAAIQSDGTLSIINGTQRTDSTKVPNGIPPFTIVTGNLDNSDDGSSELVITDGKQGVWVYTKELKLAPGWSEKPNDWANTYHFDRENSKDRNSFTLNPSSPALADLNRNGNLDIIVSGTNGIYALNRRGALLSRWPAYLDGRYWYQRGSVATSPVVISTDRSHNHPLVLFSSPTGERATFGVTKIETADKERGVITFRRDNGTLDSLWDLSASTIDTVLTLGDSLIYPYILPGGFIDALGANAARPVERIGSWAVPQSRWPLSAGAPITTSPLVHRTTQESVPHLFAVASDGTIYRWELNGIIADSLYWPQNGFDAARSFAYGGPAPKSDENVKQKAPIVFWNFPNPTSKTDPYTTFKYQFSGPATNVRLDIQSITGKNMDSFTGLSGDFPDWNEFKVNLRKYGPGIYRCRMEATINGKKHSKMWKMAVVK